MGKRTFCRLAWAGAAATVVFAALLSAQTPNGELVFAGKVVDSATGAPVPRARVTLSWQSVSTDLTAGRRFSQTEKNVLTGPDGSYRFDRLPQGIFSLSAEKPQFDAVRIQGLRAAEENAVLKLTPLGTLEGTITDSDGDPIQAANVELLQLRVEDGLRDFDVLETRLTDDCGRYRFWGLHAGRYFLRMAGRGGGVYSYVGARAPNLTDRESFAAVYFGGAETLASARPIKLGDGRHVVADMTVSPKPAYLIRGTLAGFAPYSRTSFEVFRNGEKLPGARVALNTIQGRFEIHDVVPGVYLVRVSQGQAANRLSGEVELQVDSADIEGVDIPLLSLPEISGSVNCIDCSADETDYPPGLWICFYRLNAVGDTKCDSVNWDKAGSIKLTGVLPGEYQFDCSECHGYVQSADAGAQDLLANPRLRIRPGATALEFHLTVRKHAGGIAVNVSATESKDGFLVIAVPDDPTSGAPRKCVTDASRSGVIGTLKPGDYTVYAVENRDLEYQNPEVLRSLQHGVKVHVDPRGLSKVSLQELAQ